MNKNINMALYRLEKAKEDLKASEIMYRENLLKAANNRAYYAILHAIKSVLALERIDFKRHKDVIGYFNKTYVKTEIFPKMLGRKIGLASAIREDSDYDYDFVADPDNTKNQIETAKELIELVETYINNRK